ncbi:MAG: CU044_2847 family protein [Dehalococcoidia bacterium]
MKRLVETKFASGGTLMVEVDEPEDAAPARPLTRGISAAGPTQVTERTQSTFEAAMQIIAPTAEKLIEAMAAVSRTPDLLTLSFGLSMTASAGVILTSASVTGNFTVSMTWMRTPPHSPLMPLH